MVKDVNAPKKPLSAFFRYAATVREEVKEQGFVGKTAGIEIGKKWAQVSDEVKAEYQRQYQEEMVDFKKVFDVYKETDEYQQFQSLRKEKRAKKARKKLKDPNRPKKAPTGYFIYCMEMRPILKQQLEDTSIKAISQKLGEGWQSLGDEGREIYKEKSAQMKVEADRKWEEYKQSDQYKEFQQKVSALEGVRKMKAKSTKKKVEKMSVKDKKVAKKQAKKEKQAARKAALKAKKSTKKERETRKKAALKAKKVALKAKKLAKKVALKAKKQAKKEKQAARKAASKAKRARKRVPRRR